MASAKSRSSVGIPLREMLPHALVSRTLQRDNRRLRCVKSSAHSHPWQRPPLVCKAGERQNSESRKRNLERADARAAWTAHRVAIRCRGRSPARTQRREVPECESTTQTRDPKPNFGPAACRRASDSREPATARRATNRSPARPQPAHRTEAVQNWSVTDLNSSQSKSYVALRSARKHSCAYRTETHSVPNVAGNRSVCTHS